MLDTYSGNSLGFLFQDDAITSSGELRFYVPIDEYGSGGNVYLSTTVSLETDKWYFIVGCANSSRIEIWLDGQLIASGNNSWPIMILDENNFYVGTDIEAAYGDGYPFEGYIDEIALYNRFLTPAEIRADYSENSITFNTQGSPKDMPFTGSPALSDPYSKLVIQPIGFPFATSYQYYLTRFGVKLDKTLIKDMYPKPELYVYDNYDSDGYDMNIPSSNDNATIRWIFNGTKPLPILEYNITKDNKNFTQYSFEWNDTAITRIHINSLDNNVSLLSHFYIFKEGSAWIDTNQTLPVIVYKYNHSYWGQLYFGFTVTSMDSYYIGTTDQMSSAKQAGGFTNSSSPIIDDTIYVGYATHNLTSGDTVAFVITVSSLWDDATWKARYASQNYDSLLTSCKTYWNQINDEVESNLGNVPERYHYHIYVACQQIIMHEIQVTSSMFYLESGLLAWQGDWVRDASRTAEGLVRFLPDHAKYILNFFNNVTSFDYANNYYPNGTNIGVGPMTDYGAVFVISLYEVYTQTNDFSLIQNLTTRLDDCYNWIQTYISSDKKHIYAPHPHDFWDDYSSLTSSVEKKYEALIDVLWCVAAKYMAYFYDKLGNSTKANYLKEVHKSLYDGLSDYRTNDGTWSGLWYAWDTNDQISQIYTSEANIRSAHYFGDVQTWYWLNEHLDKFDYPGADIRGIFHFDEGDTTGAWSPHASEVAQMYYGYDNNFTFWDAYLNASLLGVQREGIGLYDGKYATLGEGTGGADTFPWSYGSFLWSASRIWKDRIYNYTFTSDDICVMYVDPSLTLISQNLSGTTINITLDGIKDVYSYVIVRTPYLFSDYKVISTTNISSYTIEKYAYNYSDEQRYDKLRIIFVQNTSGYANIIISITAFPPDPAQAGISDIEGKWVYKEEKYYDFFLSLDVDVNEGASLSEASIKFYDESWITVSYSSGLWSILSGSDVINIIDGSIEENGNNITVHFPIFFKNNIPNAQNIELYSKSIDSYGGTRGWGLVQVNYFNIGYRGYENVPLKRSSDYNYNPVPKFNPFDPWSLMKQYLRVGNLVGFVTAIYVNLIGEAFFGILILIISVPLYLRTQSFAYVSILWILLSGTLVYVLPLGTVKIVWIFLILGIGGLLYKLFISTRE